MVFIFYAIWVPFHFFFCYFIYDLCLVYFPVIDLRFVILQLYILIFFFYIDQSFNKDHHHHSFLEVYFPSNTFNNFLKNFPLLQHPYSYPNLPAHIYAFQFLSISIFFLLCAILLPLFHHFLLIFPYPSILITDHSLCHPSIFCVLLCSGNFIIHFSPSMFISCDVIIM